MSAETVAPPHRDPAEQIASLEDALNRLHSWDGLMHLLDEHWPAEVFPTLPDREGRDPGPRIVSLIRALDRVTRQRDGLDDELSAAQAEVRRLRALLDAR